jgi:hypothetical protein
MSERLGILAYGSLIDDPGDEIAVATAEILYDGIVTPFAVEFARSSRTRAGAPTLVPVATGGAPVPARIYVLRDDISGQEARGMLWRRETRAPGRAPSPAGRPKSVSNDVLIDYVENFLGISTVLYTRLAANIAPLTPQRLAELALNSARCGEVLAQGRDGISYLISAQGNGIHTKLSRAYEVELLRQTGAVTLGEALVRIRAQGIRKPREKVE